VTNHGHSRKKKSESDTHHQMNVEPHGIADAQNEFGEGDN
jgi:hypothetical protein